MTELEVYFDYQYFGFGLEKVELVFANPAVVVDSLRGYEMINKSVSITISGREIKEDNLGLGLAGEITFYISLIPLAIGVFVSFFGFGIGIPFDFITTMQMVHLTPVM